VRARLLYHTVTCCRFDCMVRSCTCKQAPVVVDYDGSLEEFLRGAALHTGDALEDGRTVDTFAYWEETPEGALAEFTTRDSASPETECDSSGRPGEVEDGSRT